MSKSVLRIAKINLMNVKTAYFVAALLVLNIVVQFFVQYLMAVNGADMSHSSNVSGGMMLWIVPLLAATIIPARNFRRICNLGGRRNNFFWGTLIAYGMLALLVSLANVLVFYTIDRFLQNSGLFDQSLFGGVFNLLEIFGWTANGVIIAFLRQAAFLFLVASFVHTLVSIQDKWYGWVTDVVLIAIISVFTPIAPLRAVLVWFFNIILFHPNALLHILYCVGLGLVIYTLNKPIYARKAI